MTDIYQVTLKVLTSIGILALTWVLGWFIGKAIKTLVVKVLNKIGADEWLRRFSFGRAIRRTGLFISEFFGILIEWIIYVTFIVLGVYFACAYAEWIDVADIAAKILTIYIGGFVRAFIVIIPGFILIDVFIGYIYRSSELRTEAQLLTPIAEYLRILLYIVVMIFALEQGGINVEALTHILTPILWGLTAAMLLVIIYNILQSTRGKPSTSV
ncbi:MAG: hypothetical protein QXP02_04335 [Desulfurococcaceae archaeon]